MEATTLANIPATRTTQQRPRQMRRRRAVRFDHHEQIHLTTGLGEYTKAERDACWHSGDELDALKLKAKEEALRALVSKHGRRKIESAGEKEEVGGAHRRPGGEVFDNDDLRGLEHLADPAALVKRERRRRKTAAAVLEAQGRGSPGEFDAEATARVSRKITSKARKEAARLGAEDARAAAKLHGRYSALLASASSLCERGDGSAHRRERDINLTSDLLDRVRNIVVRDLIAPRNIVTKEYGVQILQRGLVKRMNIIEAKTETDVT
eukprot:CAMPEP_0113529238 /NCGR_PEP_ID=MMETSP0015_2-20120614/2285_1 /TAXON_ID=2838 /ORGANISM="Odontella" /LENGTH=265 /DNA_ID=CAMNT_0000427851 /DNA_START=103 /DNA_END=897 /DNA_ORIENTATION=- /assembly_acc=CAM_ASM_000160